MTEYFYKGRRYRIVTESKMKIGGTWVPVVIYKCLYENPDGKFWVREREEFFKLFEEIPQKKLVQPPPPIEQFPEDFWDIYEEEARKAFYGVPDEP